MKKNLLSSLALAFATAFALADGNLGTPTKVGSLSRSADYVYKADEVDVLLTARDNVVEDILVGGQSIRPGTGTTFSIPYAESAQMGTVVLSDLTNSDSDASSHTAATPKAVKDALTSAKSYANTAYTHPTHTARTGKPAANQAPGFGGTFTVSQVLSDGNGHVTNLVDRTITIPSTNATTTTAGLMSAADKTALNALSSGAVTKSAITAALQMQGLSAANDTAASLDDMDTIAAKVAAIIAVLDALD